MLVTLDVSHCEISWLKSYLFMNSSSMFVTSDTSQSDIGLLPAAPQLAPDDVKLYQHLVGSGKQVEVTEAFVGDKLDLLRRFLRGRGQEVMDSALERGEVSVHVFLRAKVDLEVFHSVEYLRTRSRCSHHVCYQLKGDDASTRRYGRVLRYSKMQEILAQGTFRFCEMDCFREITTEEDKALGYGTVSKASPDTMFVALEDFRRKVILFSPQTVKHATKRACCSAGPRVEYDFSSASRANSERAASEQRADSERTANERALILVLARARARARAAAACVLLRAVCQ